MLKILGRKNSSNVQKVLWACAELQLGFEREDVGGAFGKNDQPDYLALNPNGLVPTLLDDEFVLWESHAIVRYLTNKRAPNVLHPDDPRQLALADQWMDWCNTTVAPVMRPVFWGLVRTPAEQRDMPAIDAARDELAGCMGILDQHLSRSAYVAGDRFTMGDIPLGVQAYRWYNMTMKREALPDLARWYDSLVGRRAFRENVMIGLGPA